MKKGRTTSIDTAPIKERNARISFCSSANLRNTRHKLETNARGPPNRKNITKKTTPAQGSGERNMGLIRIMSEKLFQLPIPPTIKPRMEDAFTSGVSSSQCDLGSNEES